MSEVPSSSPKLHGNTVEQLFNQLKKSIQNGTFAPGQRLVATDLVKDYGVSRGPLREAFRRLGAEGFIDVVPNKGAIVKKFSRKQIHDLFLIRQVIEGLATRLATENLKEHGLKEEHQMLEQIASGAPDDIANFSEENSRFHSTILRLCDNQKLQSLVEQMQLPFVKYQIRGSLDRDYITSSKKEHSQIATAMLAGDAKLAERLMQKHLANAADRVMKLPDIFP